MADPRDGRKGPKPRDVARLDGVADLAECLEREPGIACRHIVGETGDGRVALDPHTAARDRCAEVEAQRIGAVFYGRP